MTTVHQPPRGIAARVPAQDTATAGQRAAAQMLGLRNVTLPAAVISAAAELLDDRLGEQSDAVTREATAAVLSRLRAAIGQEQPAQR
ncbi:hypothetical protein [Kitasatospora sp. NPDC088346]|uniref:hypothetical protein n=1 Tax=Kitasatospora sp. NPDC088346 TaxID=3364073 RepID=UPI003830BB7C